MCIQNNIGFTKEKSEIFIIEIGDKKNNQTRLGRKSHQY